MLFSPAPQPRSRTVRPRTSPSRARMKRFSGAVDRSKVAATSTRSTRIIAARPSWKMRSRRTRSSAVIGDIQYRRPRAGRPGGTRLPTLARRKGMRYVGRRVRPMAAQRKPAVPKRPPVPEETTSSISTSVWALLLLVVTLGAFAPTFGAEFIKWDDQFYVEENALLQDPGALRKIWDPVGRETQEYYPILFSSYWLEYQVWRLDAAAYHAVTLALHLANVVLVLLLARGLGAKGWVAAATAAIFAVHPVQVASVAWISEQKNTLSALFYLVAFLLYLRHRRTGRWTAYAGCLASFAAALLSKTQTLTFPLSILLAEWLLLRRPGVPLRTA